MRYPKFLSKGDKIGFIAPSFGCSTEPYKSAFNAALAKFNEMGCQTVLGPNCYESAGIGKSNTPQLCGEEINRFFTSDECDVIISCGGGETMCEDLNFVDFDRIAKAKAKWYLGYSDNTNLTFTLPTICDTAAIYGPCAPAFGMEPWHESLHDVMSLLTGEKLKVKNYTKWEIESKKDEENPFEPYNVTEPFKMRLVSNEQTDLVQIRGRLIGGCLDCLQTLAGTTFDHVMQFNERYAKDGIVWFIESCDFSTIGMRRALWQLDNAGWFKNVKGFLIGRPYNLESFMGLDRYDAVLGVLSKYKVPILFDVDLGHRPPMMPIISGAQACITTDGRSVLIDYNLN